MVTNAKDKISPEAVRAVMDTLASVSREQLQFERDQLEAKRLDQSPRGGLSPEWMVRLRAIQALLTDVRNL